MYVPPQRVRPKLVTHISREVPQFQRFIRRRCCSVKGCQNTDIVCAHIRCDLPADALKGGTGLKPHDMWIIPLCNEHHAEQHRGERSFARKYGLDPVELAKALWALWLKTATGIKWARANL